MLEKAVDFFFFLAALGLCCCTQTLRSCGEWVLLFTEVCRLLLLWSWSLGTRAPVVVAHKLSCSLAHGLFPDPGSNPRLLHWWMDAYPLYLQRIPLT